MVGMVNINNCPQHELSEGYIVARLCDGELWYYGNYDEENAKRVAIAVDGIVAKVGDCDG